MTKALASSVLALLVPEIRDILKKAMFKAGVFATVYIAFYGWFTWFRWRKTKPGTV